MTEPTKQPNPPKPAPTMAGDVAMCLIAGAAGRGLDPKAVIAHAMVNTCRHCGRDIPQSIGGNNGFVCWRCK